MVGFLLKWNFCYFLFGGGGGVVDFFFIFDIFLMEYNKDLIRIICFVEMLCNIFYCLDFFILIDLICCKNVNLWWVI